LVYFSVTDLMARDLALFDQFLQVLAFLTCQVNYILLVRSRSSYQCFRSYNYIGKKISNKTLLYLLRSTSLLTATVSLTTADDTPDAIQIHAPITNHGSVP
jgi:hypothetical protein